MRWGRRWVAATQDESRKYDRDFLLSPTKRNELVELWEVEKYERDCFNDPDHVRLYGLPPKAWYDRGVRILARTCLEAVKDPLGNKIGRDIAEVVLPAAGNRAVEVVDPFACSCNTTASPGSQGLPCHGVFPPAQKFGESDLLLNFLRRQQPRGI